MNFFGYVQLRRGILNHLNEGKLTNNEWLVLVVLIILADKKTGAGTINAACLRSFVPGLSYDAAKRALLSLQEKHYIYRKIKYMSNIAYPFWVNRYIPTDGPHRGLQIDLAKVFESNDVSDIMYINPAPEDAPQGAPEGALDPALNYKNRELKHKKENKPSISNSGENASVCASPDAMQIAAAQRNMLRPSALPCALPSNDPIHNANATPSSLPVRTPERSAQTRVEKLDMATVLRAGMEDRSLLAAAGMRFGHEGAFESLQGWELSSDEAYRRLLPYVSNLEANA